MLKWYYGYVFKESLSSRNTHCSITDVMMSQIASKCHIKGGVHTGQGLIASEAGWWVSWGPVHCCLFFMGGYDENYIAYEFGVISQYGTKPTPQTFMSLDISVQYVKFV